MCIYDLSIHKSVWFLAYPAILSVIVDVIIMLVHMLITNCLLFSVSSLLLGTMFMVFSCVLLTWMLLCLFLSVSSLLLLLELPCTLSVESVS